MRITFALLCCALALPLSGCRWQIGYPSPAVQQPSDVHDFAVLYSENCSACHGAGGENGPATDLANPEYEALIDDGTLRKWIAEGMPGTQMPAFAQSDGGMLTSQQVDEIVAGMRKAWSRPNAFDGAQPPPYAQDHAADTRRGEQVYQARCAVCHTGAGHRLTNPIYLALIGDQALRSIIIAGSPDIGQPDWRHDSAGGQPAAPLSSQDVDDIVGYLASVRNLSPAYSGTAPTPAASSAAATPQAAAAPHQKTNQAKAPTGGAKRESQ
jgi:cytochrome c oxidase cbb3-type subunit 3